MNIRGLNKFTLIDYPGKIACVVFTAGCNFLCPYCHNPFLVIDPESQPLIDENDVYKFLDSRIGKLDAVVISGGEPTLRKKIFAFASEIKKRGFLIKLDTNGSNLCAVKKLYESNCLDFIGLDYKAPQSKYNALSKSMNFSIYKQITETISFIVETGIKSDIRTTVHKLLLSESDLFTMRTELNSLGVKDWTLQQFNPTEIMDEDLNEIPTYSDIELVSIAGKLPYTQVKSKKARITSGLF